MNITTARNSSEDGIANCDSCGTAAGNFSVEGLASDRPAEQGIGASCLPLSPANEIQLFIFLYLLRILHSSPRVSIARTMQGASAQNIGMCAHSMRNMSSECTSAEALRPGASNPDSREFSPVRPLPSLDRKDPLGIRPSSRARRRTTGNARPSSGSPGFE